MSIHILKVFHYRVAPQDAYNSGKHGNLREFVHSGKLREFKIYLGNLSDAVFL